MRHKSRLGSVLVQKSGHADEDVQISALDTFNEKDGRKSRYIGEMLVRYRGEDELVEKWTCLNVLEKKICKLNPKKILMDEKSWKTWKSNQKIVMDEELVQNVVMDEALVRNIVMDEALVRNTVMNEELIQNGVMDEKIVKNFVMDANIDPKVVMDLSIIKIDGWNILQPSNRKLLEDFIDEKEPWLLIGIPCRDSFLTIQYLKRHFVSSDQHVKELIPLREGLHVTMQCCMRQNFAGRHWLHEHPGRHESWRESTRMKFTKGSIVYFMKWPICR